MGVHAALRAHRGRQGRTIQCRRGVEAQPIGALDAPPGHEYPRSRRERRNVRLVEGRHQADLGCDRRQREALRVALESRRRVRRISR